MCARSYLGRGCRGVPAAGGGRTPAPEGLRGGQQALRPTASTPPLSSLRIRPFSLLCSGLSTGARRVSNWVTDVSNLSMFCKFVIAICECLCICDNVVVTVMQIRINLWIYNLGCQNYHFKFWIPMLQILGPPCRRPWSRNSCRPRPTGAPEACALPCRLPQPLFSSPTTTASLFIAVEVRCLTPSRRARWGILPHLLPHLSICWHACALILQWMCSVDLLPCLHYVHLLPYLWSLII